MEDVYSMRPPCISLVIEDEPAVRSLLMMMLSDLNCAVLASESGAGLRAQLMTLEPDIVFLDIGLRGGDASDILTLLAGCGYAGTVQIVSGQPGDVVARAKKIGDGLGLHMSEPIAKPFRMETLEQVVARVQRQAAPLNGDFLEQHVWLRALAGSPGLIDLRLPADTAAGQQLEWWLDYGPRYTSSLLGLPATCSFAVRATLADVPDLVAILSHYRPAAFLTMPIVLIEEDGVFEDLATARSALLAARQCGLIIRLTNCGTRFFSIAGHRPLPVDQAEIGQFLQGGDQGNRIERLPCLADIAHRAGAILLADDMRCPVGRFAGGGLDLWRSSDASWVPIAMPLPVRTESAVRRIPQREWQSVTVQDALALRKAS